MAEEPTEIGENRNPDGTFKDGNPGGPGRPPGSISIISKIRKVFEDKPEYFDEYVKDVLEDPKLRQEIIRQLDGAPIQKTLISGELTTRTELTDEQFERLIRQRAEGLNSGESLP